MNCGKSGKHPRDLRSAPQGTEEEGGDGGKIPRGMGELTADDNACVARVSLWRCCAFALRSFAPLNLPFVCTAVKGRFCSGLGQSTNLAHFYVFLTLHRVNLMDFISGGVSGDGSAYDKGEPGNKDKPEKKKTKNKHQNQNRFWF